MKTYSTDRCLKCSSLDTDRVNADGAIYVSCHTCKHQILIPDLLPKPRYITLYQLLRIYIQPCKFKIYYDGECISGPLGSKALKIFNANDIKDLQSLYVDHITFSDDLMNVFVISCD